MLLKDNIILSHTVLVELERLFFLDLLFRSYYVNGKLDILLRQYYKVFFMFETQKPRNPSAGASVRFSAEKSVSTSSHVHEKAMCMKKPCAMATREMEITCCKDLSEAITCFERD